MAVWDGFWENLFQLFSAIRDWFNPTPQMGVAFALWLLIAGLHYGLMRVRRGTDKAKPSRDLVWIDRLSRIVFPFATAVLALFLLPESIVERLEFKAQSYLYQAGMLEPHPLRWKLETGAVALLRFEGERIHVDVLSGRESRGGIRVAELTKQGRGYSGAAQVGMPCPAGRPPHASCTKEVPIEFTLVQQRRIEGRLGLDPEKSQAACPHCRTQWKEFVWVPE